MYFRVYCAHITPIMFNNLSTYNLDELVEPLPFLINSSDENEACYSAMEKLVSHPKQSKSPAIMVGLFFYLKLLANIRMIPAQPITQIGKLDSIIYKTVRIVFQLRYLG